MKPEIITIPIAPDNYAYLIVCGYEAAVVDSSKAEPVLSILRDRGLSLKYVLSSHHHSDHTGANKALKDATGALVTGGDSRIASIDSVLDDGSAVQLGECTVEVIRVPGHTKKGVAYFLSSSRIVFTGDTLFGAGCGRVFEGSADQMYRSLMSLAELPDDTLVYYGHEYTVNNLEFALTVEPDNEQVQIRLEKVKKLVSSSGCTVPSTIEEEKRTNPFLRAHSKSIRKAIQMIGRSPVAVFSELRKRKDRF